MTELMTGKVVGLKLSSGEEIIGKIRNLSLDRFDLQNPAKIELTDSNVVLRPFMVHAKGGLIELLMRDFSCLCDLDELLIEHYEKIFEVNTIVVQDKKIIIHRAEFGIQPLIDRSLLIT